MSKVKLPSHVELHEDTINEVKEFIETLSMPVEIKYAFVGCPKQKQTVIIKKVPKVYEFIFETQVVVMINEELYEQVALDEQAMKIILNDAFHGLSADTNSGEVKIKNENFTSSKGIIEKFGLDNVKDAKDLEKSIYEQIKDTLADQDVIDIAD